MHSYALQYLYHHSLRLLCSNLCASNTTDTVDGLKPYSESTAIFKTAGASKIRTVYRAAYDSKYRIRICIQTKHAQKDYNNRQYKI